MDRKRTMADILTDSNTVIIALLVLVVLLCTSVVVEGIIIRNLLEVNKTTYIWEREEIKVQLEPEQEPEPISEPTAEVIEETAETTAEPEETVVFITNGDVIESYEVVTAKDEFRKDYILKVLTAEAGTDSLLCKCVAQCLYNACKKYDWKYDPYEMMLRYSYAPPCTWFSEEAKEAYEFIFEQGGICGDVLDALFFYAPKYCTSSWHETQRFIAEIHGVRFFGEW